MSCLGDCKYTNMVFRTSCLMRCPQATLEIFSVLIAKFIKCSMSCDLSCDSLVQDGGYGGGRVRFGGSPEDNTVLTRLGQCHLPKPTHTVDVVTMNITS